MKPHSFRELHTPLCERLGIEHPILQSGMGRIAGPELVAQVCSAGGLGILAGLMVPPNALREQIRAVRALTDRPFGVNLWLHPRLMPPVRVADVPSDELARATSALDVMRERLGLAKASAPPNDVPDTIEAAFEVILEERVAVFSAGLGDPGPERTARCHERGVQVIAMATNVDDARALAGSQVDAIIAQGAEAGGHRSNWSEPPAPPTASIGTLALVPQIVDAVELPVVAAGGISDGRGLVAARALGAQAVMLGTRFVACRESMAPPFFKQAVIDGGGDATVLTSVYTGLAARGLQNRFADEYAASGAPVLPPLLQSSAAADIYAAALARGDPDHYPMLAGQACGMIEDLPSAGEIVRAMVTEAEALLAG